MILIDGKVLIIALSAPRTSGDDPSATATDATKTECSPHERG